MTHSEWLTFSMWATYAAVGCFVVAIIGTLVLLFWKGDE